MSVVVALERELERLPVDLATGALAASALAMAGEIDKPSNSATSKSMCQARLQDALAALWAMAPPAEETDHLDELRTRRERRIAGVPAA